MTKFGLALVDEIGVSRTVVRNRWNTGMTKRIGRKHLSANGDLTNKRPKGRNVRRRRPHFRPKTVRVHPFPD